jgi:hypothetical protein
MTVALALTRLPMASAAQDAPPGSGAGQRGTGAASADTPATGVPDNANGASSADPPSTDAPASPAPDDAPAATAPTADAAQAQDEGTDPDMVLKPAQPEFTIVNLPTTLRVPKHKLAFRVTHRFTRDLTTGGFDDLLADFFGFDGGAQIGLELRYGLMRGWQVGINRTSDRTIELFTQYNVLRQGDGFFMDVDALATFEGTNNLNDEDPIQPTGEGIRSPALGVVVSRVFGRTAALNATLAWVNNTNALPSELANHNDTVILGIGGRLRLRPSLYLVGEVTPRIGGDDPGSTLASFGVEMRAGGHAFQMNFSNGFGTTLAQIARGGIDSDHWSVGFNINRKFF